MAIFRIEEGKLFKRQWADYALAYRHSAGKDIAERFIAALIDALDFIQHNPYACPVYDPGEEVADLQIHQYRKWSLHGFPHAILFRVHNDDTVFVDIVYAHKMNMGYRLAVDTADDHTH